MARRVLLAVFMLLAMLAGLALLMPAAPVLGQQDEAQERGLFIRFVEDQLSGPGRVIRLDGLDGALSSNASIGAITIADEVGIWLTITNASLVWNRAALLRGRLEIESLSAETIDFPRLPQPVPAPPSAEASRLALPDLPVEIAIASLSVESIAFGEPVFGLASQLSANGRLSLVEGSLDTALAFDRLDGPGGLLALEARYDAGRRTLALDLDLDEPANGMLANLLNLEGRPSLSLSLAGEGPADNLDLALSLDAAGARALTGMAQLRGADGGTAFSSQISGTLQGLIPSAYQAFFGAQTELSLNGIVRSDGGYGLERLNLASGALSLQANGQTTADGFLSALQLDAAMRPTQGISLLLPIAGQGVRATGGSMQVRYGGSGAQDGPADWTASFGLDGLSTPTITTQRVAFSLAGTASDLADQARRSLSFAGQGGARGLASPDPALAHALGNELAMVLRGSWQAGNPLLLQTASLVGNGLYLRAAGQFSGGVFDGTLRADLASLLPFGGLADRDLNGSLNMRASGTIDALSGGFNLDIDGAGTDLQIGQAALDGLLSGTTRLSGTVLRDETGTAARGLRLENT